MGLTIPLLIACFLLTHPIHVSYTHIEVEQKQRTITVSHKFYTNDFSLLFYHLYEKEIDFQPDKAITEPETKLIDGYIKQRFIMVADKDTLITDFLRSEQDEESLWFHYSAALKNAAVNNLIVNNLLLLDLYMDQTNLVIIKHGKEEDGFSCDFSNRQVVLKLKE